MAYALKLFLGFLMGFGLYEGLNVLLADGPVDLGATVADIVGPAFFATVIVVLFERWKGRRRRA